jgi:hypothetical protein
MKQVSRFVCGLCLGIVVVAGAACANDFTNEPPVPTCAAPGCPAGTVSGVVRSDDGSVTGLWGSPAGSGQIQFMVNVQDDGVVASFGVPGETPMLVVNLADTETGFVIWGDAMVDGNGDPDSTEAAALDAIAANADLVASLAAVPLELGCGDVELTEAEMAALILPWQMLLKYRTDNRLTTVKVQADGSSCAYYQTFTEIPSGLKVPTGLLLSYEHPLPSAFNYYPLDDYGAFEVESQSVTGAIVAAEGPCNSKCRGACGADCSKNNCTETVDGECVKSAGLNTGELRRTVTEDCGLHQGCIDHDDCYDACNVNYDCGKNWGMFGCLRGCDGAAVKAWGVSNTQSWARGYGPFERREIFDIVTVSTDFETCPLEVDTTDKLPGRIYLGTTPSGESGFLSMGLFTVWPNDGKYDLVSARPVDGVAISPNSKILAAGILQLNDMPPYLGLYDASEPTEVTPMEGVGNLTPGETTNAQLTGPTFVNDDLIVVSDTGMLRMWDMKKKIGSKKIWDGWYSSAQANGTSALVVETSAGFRGIMDVNQSAYGDYDPWNLDPTVIQFQNEDPAHLWTVKGTENDWIRPKFSPDGNRLAFLDTSDQTVVHDARITTGGEVTDHLTYTGPGGKIKAVAWSPDGAWLVFAVIGEASAGGGLYVTEQGKIGGTAKRVLEEDLTSIWHIDLAWGL